MGRDDDIRSAGGAALGFLLAGALLAGACSSATPASGGAKYARASSPCQCGVTMKACVCNHCAGEKGASCYCEAGGCDCGADMAKCQCGHCTGLLAEPNCDCEAHAGEETGHH